MRFFLLWCAAVCSTRAQEASSVPTSTSSDASIPWITYTSTRSCTSRPSTIFVYTSNSSSFLLTHHGPSSAITTAESNSVPTVSGTHDTLASSSLLTAASSLSFDGSPAISQPPFSVISGSTCPLPRTVMVSASPPNKSCQSAAEKTVTYVMTSCLAHSDSGIAPSVVHSRTSNQLATTSQTTDGESPSNTTLAGSPGNATLVPVDSTLSNNVFTNLCASFTERTITIEHTIERTVSAPDPEPVYITFTTLQGSSTIYRTSLSERTAGASCPPLDSIMTSYIKSGDSIITTRTSGLRETSGRDFSIYTTYKEASTVYSVTTIRQTPSPITITSTELQPGTTFYSISTIRGTAIPITLTYTQFLAASVIPRTTIIRQMPTTITLTSTEVQGGNTSIRTSITTSTPEPLVSVYTETLEGVVIPRTSVVSQMPTTITLTSTEVQRGSTIVLTSIITSTPEPLTSVYTETREGSITYSTSVIVSTPDPLIVTYTEIREASTRFVTSVVESTPEPLTSTSTIIESGSLVYITSYMDRTPSAGVVTQTLTENGQTIYLTATVEKTREGPADAEPATRFTEPPVTIFITKTETLMALSDPSPGEFPPTSSLAAMPTSVFSMSASTTSSYSLQLSQDASGPANASVLTMISTIYATLNVSDCAANFSVSTITSFVYNSESSAGSNSGSLATSNSSYGPESGLATLTVTSFIYGPSMTAGSTDELMMMTITERETASCSYNFTNALSARTVTSLVYPSSCDQYTTRYAPEITVTRRGSTVTVYASSTRTVTAYPTTLGNGTLAGDASRTDSSEPTPDPGNEEAGDPDEEDEGEPEEQPDQYPTSSQPSPTTEPIQSPTAVVADPTELAAQQGATSDPFVSGQVVNPEDNPPITPASNTSFLLVTFGSASASSTTSASSTVVLGRRQSSQQPLTYNATILFSSVAGGIYNLSAAATMAQNGNTPPSCMLSICMESMCGPSYPLTTAFETYVYTYNSPSTVSNEAGIFSIRCIGQAYVGLDNVRVDTVFVPQPSPASSIPGVSSSSSAGLTAAASTPAGSSTIILGSSSSTVFSRASVRTITTSILSTFTTTAYATQTLTRIESAQVITITQVSTEPGESGTNFPHPPAIAGFGRQSDAIEHA
jgi:hypothetical protein